MVPRKAVQEQASKKIHVCDGNDSGAHRPLQNKEVLLQEVRPVWILEKTPELGSKVFTYECTDVHMDRHACS